MNPKGLFYLSGNDERDWLDGAAVDLVRAGDFAFGDVKGTTGQEAHAPLGIGGLVFCEWEERVVLILVVTDIAVSVCRSVYSLCASVCARTPCRLERYASADMAK